MTKNTLTPVEYLVKIQKLKYKYALIPFVIVISSFVLSFSSDHILLKMTSVFGLLLYFCISYLFRISRLEDVSDDSSVIAPLHGKVVSILSGEIIIKKSFWQWSEIRNPLSSQNPLYHFSKSIILFEDNSSKTAMLIGLALGNVICKVTIPAEQKIVVQIGDKTIAGITVLAQKNE